MQQDADKLLREEQLRLGKDKYIINKGKVIPREYHSAAHKLRRDQITCTSLPPTTSGNRSNSNVLRNNMILENRADDEITFKNARAITFTNSNIKSAHPGPGANCLANQTNQTSDKQAAHQGTSYRTDRRLADPLAPTQFSL